MKVLLRRTVFNLVLPCNSAWAKYQGGLMVPPLTLSLTQSNHADHVLKIQHKRCITHIIFAKIIHSMPSPLGFVRLKSSNSRTSFYK